MSNAATRKVIDEVLDIMKGFMGQVSDQFDKVADQFDRVSDQFSEIHRRLDIQDQKYDRLLSTINGFMLA